MLDDPPRIGLISATNRLRIFTAEGRDLGKAPEILGVGRIARTAPGWIAAATDRQIVLYDARRNSAQRVDLSLVEITHLAIHPDSFGLAIVQERDRLGRATPAGRWIWKRSLKSPVEDLAIGPDGVLALTTDDGQLEVLDASGATIGGFRSEPSEPLLLIAAPDASPEPVAWLTLARRAQVLRGHDLEGRVVWESPLPWEGWQLHRLGTIGLVVAPDGRTLAFDGAGHPRGKGRASTDSKDQFGATPRGRGLAGRTPGGPPDLLRPRRSREVAGRRRRPARPARRRPGRRRRHHRALPGLVLRRRGRSNDPGEFAGLRAPGRPTISDVDATYRTFVLRLMVPLVRLEILDCRMHVVQKSSPRPGEYFG